LPNPRQTQSLTLIINGDIGKFMPPNDSRQHCYREGKKLRCSINSHLDESGMSLTKDTAQGVVRFLEPSYAIPSLNPNIQRTASTITSPTASDISKINKILAWMDAHIIKKPVDVFTALDVLETRQAECQGHAYLFAAFCRAVGIPTRIANGIVFSKRHRGFLYHTWAECYINDAWMAVDPIFMQIPADATHVKFVEGESLSNLLPLIGIMGKIKVQIIQSSSTIAE
jgi:transglutaminase-like putative cysteine protease